MDKWTHLKTIRRENMPKPKHPCRPLQVCLSHEAHVQLAQLVVLYTKVEGAPGYLTKSWIVEEAIRYLVEKIESQVQVQVPELVKELVKEDAEVPNAQD